MTATITPTPVTVNQVATPLVPVGAVAGFHIQNNSNNRTVELGFGAVPVFGAGNFVLRPGETVTFWEQRGVWGICNTGFSAACVVLQTNYLFTHAPNKQF